MSANITSRLGKRAILGNVDIEFQGERYTERDGIFYGETSPSPMGIV